MVEIINEVRLVYNDQKNDMQGGHNRSKEIHLKSNEKSFDHLMAIAKALLKE